ncbi:hypothetical protein TNCV_1236221 [Trichonephila clavipes]|nr:hypothetical protein TNCV_1236221 [Trichonephila clavipes]
MPYSGFEPEPTQLQAKGHIHHTGWVTSKMIKNYIQLKSANRLHPSPNYHTTPREDVSALDRFRLHRCPTRQVFSGSGLELVTRQARIRYLYHSATAATQQCLDRFNKDATDNVRQFVTMDKTLVHPEED